jgi:hypothetical protein
MLGVLKRKKARDTKTSDEPVRFGTISHVDLLRLTAGFRELRRHIPRFIAEREKGLDLLRTVDEYRRIQHSLNVFETRWGPERLSVATGKRDIEVEFEPAIASGFALALSELVLVCRAVSTDDKLIIANISNSLLDGYQEND